MELTAWRRGGGGYGRGSGRSHTGRPGGRGLPVGSRQAVQRKLSNKIGYKSITALQKRGLVTAVSMIDSQHE